ncbi:DUF92 domain-containing protein [Mucilaginibacter sp. SP1R1]|uniref:DUF92 domain-containing protein n=1 Tax=Mucilaginibacter sp. SP1R1 TaxID=2723091 RepID=UPI0016124F5E|nr:DUF92 domain-containing protein [Mucilaginibacter sp. SP1R1]MBB6148639.1 uncharacterized protein (TIGR00297 family) [Mucilaginibacter sp. SP1R1]
MLAHYGLLVLILIVGIGYSVSAEKLTAIAAFTGAVVACLVFAGAGYTGIAMMTCFFILGSAATTWQHGKKQDFTTAREHKNGRTAGQVLANAGIAGITGVLILLWPLQAHLWLLMMTASLASATADTLSSELGTVYGRRFFNVITLKPDQRGLDGVISLEGVLIGVVGCIVISFIYALGFGWSTNLVIVIVAGTAGNLADSILGATLERKGYIRNNMVNFLNTLIAALIVLLFYFI